MEHSGSASEVIPRIAILPPADGNGVPAYLSSAIAAQASSRLREAAPEAFSIAAQDSLATLAHRGLSPAEIGAAMKADLVLTGRLAVLPGHFRLRAEMLSGADASPLWMEDIIAEQDRAGDLADELAERVLRRLLGRLETGISMSAAAEPDPQLDCDPLRHQAWALLHRARHESQSLQRHSMQDATQRLVHAVELAPALFEARVELAHLAITQALAGYLPASAAAKLARRAAEPQFARSEFAPLDMRRPDLHGPAENFAVAQGSAAILPALGWFSFHAGRDLVAALSAFDRSAHLRDPLHDQSITRARSMFALSRHRFDEAIELLRSVLRMDPYSGWLHAQLGWALHLAGDAAASIKQITQACADYPENECASLYGAIILAFNGDARRALEIVRGLVRRCPSFDLAAAAEAYALACAGSGLEARAILERLDWLSRERFVMKTFTAAVHVALGDHAAALTELRASEQSCCPWFFQMLADPRLGPLHIYPEFQELARILPRMEASAAPAAE